MSHWIEKTNYKTRMMMIFIIIDNILRSGFRADQSLRGRGQEEMSRLKEWWDKRGAES